jgi:hypothetical protein
MTFAPESSKQIPLPENISFSKDYSQFLEQITKLYRDIARSVNSKERAAYPLELEILNSQTFFTTGDPQKYRGVFRKVFEIGAVAQGATLNTAHGITNLTALTRLYGTIITDVVDYRPLPRVSTANVNQQVSLDLVGANIVLINGAAAPAITSGIIVVEYMKN